MAPPKPPPGFELDAPAAAPKPPPGFELDGAPVIQPVGGPSVLESAGRGFMQGGTYGFADELAGAADAARSLPSGAQTLASALSPGVAGLVSLAAPDTPRSEDTGDLLRTYLKARDAARAQTHAAEEANPKSFLAGSFAGAAASPGPKGLGAGRLAKQGAMYGAASGLGGSEADLAKGEILPTLVNTAVSAGTGAILAPVASGLSARFGRFLKEKSQENALKAVGARAGIADVLGNEGVRTADDARQLGQLAIDQGLVPPLSTAADVAERTGFALEKQGARIEGVLQDANKTGPADFQHAAWRAAQSAMGPNGLTTEAISKSGPAQSLIEKLLAQEGQDASFSALNRFKSDAYKGINYGAEPSLSTGLQQDVARGIRSSIEEQIAERLGPEAADELVSANRAYGGLSKIQSLAGDESRRAMGRAGVFSPGVLAASVAAGNPAPMALKAASPYLNSTVSAIQRNLAPAAMPLGQAAVKPGIQRLSEQEQDSIAAFLNGI